MGTEIMTILDHARRHREELEIGDARAAGRMAAAYAEAWSRIQEEISLAVGEIEKRRGSGLPASPSWARRLKRLQMLRDQVETQIRAFARTAGVHVGARQREAVQAAQAHSHQLLAAQDPGIRMTFDRLHTRHIETLVGTTADGSPLHELLEQIGPGLADQVADAFVAGAVIGEPVRSLARRISQIGPMGLSRALTIARTETIRSYREASRASYESLNRNAGEKVVRGWYWKAFGDACPACWAMSGTFHDAGETLDSHPNCRCSMIPAVQGSDLKVESGVERFGQLSEERQEEILGPAKFKLYQAGRIGLEDVVTVTRSERWGRGRRDATVAEALRHAHARD